MECTWSKFISDNKAVLPYIPLSTILEAFYWYLESFKTDDNNYIEHCNNTVSKLLKPE